MKSALLDNIREDHAIGVAYSKNIKRFRKKGPNVAFAECHHRSIIIKKLMLDSLLILGHWPDSPRNGLLGVILFLFFASSREAGR